MAEFELGRAKLAIDRQEAKGFLLLGGALAVEEHGRRIYLICVNWIIVDQIRKILSEVDDYVSDDNFPILLFSLKTTIQELLEKLESGGFEIVD